MFLPRSQNFWRDHEYLSHSQSRALVFSIGILVNSRMPKSSLSIAKVRRRPSGAINRLPWQGWVRFRQLPFSENKARELIDQGVLVTEIIQEPGSKRGVRLIETASLDRYLRSLAEEQNKREEVTFK